MMSKHKEVYLLYGVTAALRNTLAVCFVNKESFKRNQFDTCIQHRATVKGKVNKAEHFKRRSRRA